MGNVCIKNSNNTNRISNLAESSYVSDFGTTEDINVPDVTSVKGKSKSVSIFSKTRSFIGYSKAASVQSAVVSSGKPDTERLPIDYRELENEKLEQLSKTNKDLLDKVAQLRNEVKVLNTCVSKLKGEKKILHLAETDAVERANFFERERDKMQRQFKIFRENKEKEVQDIIKQFQHMKAKHRKCTDGSVKDYLMDSGDLRQRSQSVTDWLWDNQSYTGESYLGQKRESESEKGSAFDLKASKDTSKLLKKLLGPLLQMSYGVPDSNVYTIFLTSTESMFETAQKFIRNSRKLMLQLEMDGKLSSIMYFPIETDNKLSLSSEEKEVVTEKYLNQSDIVIALLENTDPRESIDKIIQKIEGSSKICILGVLGELPESETDQLLESLPMPEKLSICQSGNDAEDLVESCVTKLSELTKFFWKKQVEVEELLKDPMQANLASNELFLQSFDTLGTKEQNMIMEHKTGPIAKECVTNIHADIHALNEYITKDGPLQPFLFFGNPGIGKSYILSQWVLYLQQTLTDTCILYHFVSPGSENSRDPVLMMKRFGSKLLDQFSKTLETHPVGKDFPLWLERACNKYLNGVILIIDGADLLKNHEEHLKFLLDPLPVPVRVIISVSNSNYPKQWDYWPTLTAKTLNFEDNVRFFQTSLVDYIDDVDVLLNDLIKESGYAYKQKQLIQNNIGNHLHRVLTCMFITELSSLDNYVDDLYQCLNIENLTKLYIFIINKLQLKYGTSLVSEILILLHVSRNGLSFMELFDLSSESTSPNVCMILTVFEKFKMTEELCGLIQIQKLQVKEAINKIFNLTADKKMSINLRERIIQLSMKKLKARFVSYRVADELPWQLMNIDKKEALQECLENFAIFIQLHLNGKIHNLIDYWKFLDHDINTLYKIYVTLLSKLENETGFDRTMPMLYDLFGELLQDLGHYKLANQAYEKSLELKEAHYDSDDKRIGSSFIRFGKLFTHWKKFQTAEDYYKQALEIKEQNNDINNIPYVQLIEAITIVYIFQSKVTEAEMYKKQTLMLRQKVLREVLNQNFDSAMKECLIIIEDFRERQLYKEYIGDYLTEIGLVYCNLQLYDDAINIITQAIQHYAYVYGNGHALVGEAMCRLSYIYQLKNDDDKAEEWLNEALSLFLQDHEKNAELIDNSIQSYVKILNKQNRVDDIVKLYRRLIDECISSGDNSSDLLAKSSNCLAVLLCNLGRFQEVLDLYNNALLIYEKKYGFQHPLVSEVLSNFAKLHYDKRDLNMAAYLYKLSEDPNRTLDQLSQHPSSMLLNSNIQHSTFQSPASIIQQPNSPSTAISSLS